MVKVIASDMDGTLLNSSHQIHEENIVAIKKAQELGVKFTIVTGREFDGVEPLIKESGLKCDYVLMNGAEYRDEDGNIIKKINMDKNHVNEVISVVKRAGMSSQLFTPNGMYTTDTKEDALKGVVYRIHKFNKDISIEEAFEQAKNHIFFTRLKYIENMKEFIDSDIEVRKIIIFHNDIDLVEKTKKELEKIEGLAVSSSFADNIEITDIEAQKGIILGKVVEELGIDRDDVIVLGDSFNDESLFTEFRESYAMENAIPEIKKIAKYITDTNDNAGVAKAIYKSLGI